MILFVSGIEKLASESEVLADEPFDEGISSSRSIDSLDLPSCFIEIESSEDSSSCLKIFSFIFARASLCLDDSKNGFGKILVLLIPSLNLELFSHSGCKFACGVSCSIFIPSCLFIDFSPNNLVSFIILVNTSLFSIISFSSEYEVSVLMSFDGRKVS